jgi:hypothetical protein
MEVLNKYFCGTNNIGSGLEIWENCRKDPLRWPRDTLYSQKSWQ